MSEDHITSKKRSLGKSRSNSDSKKHNTSEEESVSKRRKLIVVLAVLVGVVIGLAISMAVKAVADGIAANEEEEVVEEEGMDGSVITEGCENLDALGSEDDIVYCVSLIYNGDNEELVMRKYDEIINAALERGDIEMYRDTVISKALSYADNNECEKAYQVINDESERAPLDELGQLYYYEDAADVVDGCDSNKVKEYLEKTNQIRENLRLSGQEIPENRGYDAEELELEYPEEEYLEGE